MFIRAAVIGQLKRLNPSTEEFLQAIKNNTEPVVSGEDGLNALVLAEKILNVIN